MLTLAATAVALSCIVAQVLDGDTLVVRCPTATVHVRLAEIDAPEKRQPFGQRAAAHLRRVCLGKPAIVTPTARDRYGRMVGRVTCDGVDASAAQASAGYAWAYTRYLTDPSIASVAAAAREQRLGLWRGRYPIEPSAWRKGLR